MTQSPTIRDTNIEKKLRSRAAEGGLLTLRLDLINKCNLQCVMCHYSDPDIRRRRAEVITPQQFESWFAPIGDSVKEVMLSCADEPLMSRHFTDIIGLASSFSDRMDIGLCTNAMLMTPSIRSALLTSGVTFILFSIDGAVKATVERIRVNSRFEKIVANIKALQVLKQATGSPYPRFVLDYVMMKSNIHEAVAFVELAHDLGAELIDFRHVVPSQWWDDDNEKLENFPAEFNHYRQRLLIKAKALNMTVAIPDAFPGIEAAVDEDLSDGVDLAPYYAIKADPAIGPLPVPKTFAGEFQAQTPLLNSQEFFGSAYCERPFTEVMIRNQREVLPCAWHKKVLGFLDKNTTVDQVFFGENFAALRAKMMRGEIDPACQNCPVKSGFLPTKTPDDEQFA